MFPFLFSVQLSVGNKAHKKIFNWKDCPFSLNFYLVNSHTHTHTLINVQAIALVRLLYRGASFIKIFISLSVPDPNNYSYLTPTKQSPVLPLTPTVRWTNHPLTCEISLKITNNKANSFPGFQTSGRKIWPHEVFQSSLCKKPNFSRTLVWWKR